ncbi:GNAT family N-acetyltransferase [Sinorhizobium medicae]|nr:GNAT family N-acetyltransferase [Sinorhizobium medicae]MDX1219751.1 GNAT family N-acetyltransferase [Sinorhizobium medicae]
MHDDDYYLKFETGFSKHGDEPNVLDFSVTLRKYSVSDDGGGTVLAGLNGFLVQPGHLPERDDQWYFAVFDMRSGHSMEAFRVLADERKLLEKAIKPSASWDDCGAVAHLERVWVDPSLRGRGVALRLMREAQHVLGRYGLLVILKAHPDGDDVSDAECLKLATYYQSDKQLGFAPVSKRKHPGWLLAVWHEPVVRAGDLAFFYEDD